MQSKDSYTSFEHPQGTLWYRCIGQGPQVVVFLHGFGLSSSSWLACVGHFDPSSYRILLPDLMGWGKSRATKGFDYSPHMHAQLLCDWLLSLNIEQFALAGHSFGGGVALMMATLGPEQLRTRINKIVLLDTMCYPQPFPLFLRLLRLPLLGSLLVHAIPPKSRYQSMLTQFYYAPNRLSETQNTLTIDSLRDGSAAMVRAARSLSAARYEELCERYSSITQPTLIIWGAQDGIIPPAFALRLCQQLPDARREVFSDCGHLPHEELPQQTATLIKQFL